MQGSDTEIKMWTDWAQEQPLSILPPNLVKEFSQCKDCVLMLHHIMDSSKRPPLHDIPIPMTSAFSLPKQEEYNEEVSLK